MCILHLPIARTVSSFPVKIILCPSVLVLEITLCISRIANIWLNSLPYLGLNFTPVFIPIPAPVISPRSTPNPVPVPAPDIMLHAVTPAQSCNVDIVADVFPSQSPVSKQNSKRREATNHDSMFSMLCKSRWWLKSHLDGAGGAGKF